MKEIIYVTVNFYLTDETFEEVESIIKEEEEDRFFWNQLQEVYHECLKTNDPALWDIYSDLHKDYWGVRPH